MKENAAGWSKERRIDAEIGCNGTHQRNACFRAASHVRNDIVLINCPVSTRNSAQLEFNYNDVTIARTYFRFVNYVDALNLRRLWQSSWKVTKDRVGDVHIFNISKVAARSYTGMEREVNCYFVTRRVRNPLWDDGVLRICMKKERAFQQLVYKLLPNECKFFFESSLDESRGICLRKYDVIVRRNIASSPPLVEAARNALNILRYSFAIFIFRDARVQIITSNFKYWNAMIKDAHLRVPSYKVFFKLLHYLVLSKTFYYVNVKCCTGCI